MARDHREDAGEPVVLDLVKVRMADTAKQDIELNIMRADFTALEVPGRQIGCRRLRGISFYRDHNSLVFFIDPAKLTKILKTGLTKILLGPDPCEFIWS
jgi:hypothetical protein